MRALTQRRRSSSPPTVNEELSARVGIAHGVNAKATPALSSKTGETAARSCAAGARRPRASGVCGSGSTPTPPAKGLKASGRSSRVGDLLLDFALQHDRAL